MAAAGAKEHDAQLESVQQEAAASHGLEDGEHVEAVGKEGDESGVDVKLAGSGSVGDGNVEAEKEEGVVSATPAVVTDIEKKRKRAERFGTDLKISEAEKRKLRAARFNDGSMNGVAAADVVVEAGKTGGAKVPADSSKSASAEAKSALIAAENAKRKARAERFGSVPQEEVTVKPKFSKNQVAAKPKFSQDEEAKKKARMARFAMAAI